jgi:tetratricopeptide (TPR) repeat protein
MPASSLETVNQLFSTLKAAPEVDASSLCEQLIELFPTLLKEEQNNLSVDFYKWAEKLKIKYPLIFCYARFLKLANHFFCEKHEIVLSEGPALQLAFLKNTEPGPAAAIGALLGSFHRTLGNIELSLKELWDTYGQLNKLNRFQHYKLACSFHIGCIYMDLENHEEALPILQNTLALAEKLQDSTFIVYTSHGLGKLFLKQKKYENARLMFQEALDASNKAGTPALISSAETEMANYYFETGNYEASELLHRKAAEMRIANQLISGAISNFIRLGEIHMKQWQQDEAIEVLNKGLAFAEQIKVKPKMYQLHLLLSEIHLYKNDLSISLFHYKQYHSLQDEVGKEDNVKKVKNMKLVFEAEQTKKENSIIKKQKVEIQKKNIELQHTIDELTITRAGKKAKAFTLLIAVVFFVFEDSILHLIFHFLPGNNYWLSVIVKMVFIFSLKPINGAIEHYLVKKVIKKKRMALEEEEHMDNSVSTDLNFAL